MKDTVLDHSRQRYHRILWSTSSGWGARIVTALVGLISVPLAAKCLGVERYGIWITVSTVVGWLSLSDFGLANYLTTALAHAFGKEDVRAARLKTTAVFWSLVGIAVVMAAAISAVWPFVPWNRIFNTGDFVRPSEVSDLVEVVLITTLAALPLSLAYRVRDAYQEGWMVNLYQTASSLAVLAWVLFAVRSNVKMSYLAVILLGPATAASAVACVQLFGRERPWLIGAPSVIERRSFGEALRGGSWFFLTALQSLFWLSKDNLVIAQLFGAETVGPYNTAFRVYASLLGLLGSRLGQSLWPAYAEAMGRNHWSWVQSAYRRSSMVTMSLYVALAAVFAFFGGPIIRLWAGSLLVPSASVIWSLALEFAVLCWINLMGYLLMAANRAKPIAVSGLIAGVCSVPLSIALARVMGPVGVPIANVICLGSFVVFPLRSAANTLLSEAATEAIPAGSAG